jgi:aspartyl-tRNA(Asn)/glutamyl-tRNA(Gln) amidotransferase subunit C
MEIDIKRVSKLARLEIEDDKAAKFAKDMNSIVSMVEDLPCTDNIDDSLDKDNVMTLRKDEYEEGKFRRDDLLSNAPAVESGCIVVPKTVE